MKEITFIFISMSKQLDLMIYQVVKHPITLKNKIARIHFIFNKLSWRTSNSSYYFFFIKSIIHIHIIYIILCLLKYDLLKTNWYAFIPLISCVVIGIFVKHWLKYKWPHNMGNDLTPNIMMLALNDWLKTFLYEEIYKNTY